MMIFRRWYGFLNGKILETHTYIVRAWYLYTAYVVLSYLISIILCHSVLAKHKDSLMLNFQGLENCPLDIKKMNVPQIKVLL